MNRCYRVHSLLVRRLQNFPREYPIGIPNRFSFRHKLQEAQPRLFIIFWKFGFWKNHRGHRENSNSLYPPCSLWLIFFAIPNIHPEEIKKPRPTHDFKASFLRVPNGKTCLISVFPVIPATIIFSDILFEFNLLCGFISYVWFYILWLVQQEETQHSHDPTLRLRTKLVWHYSPPENIRARY